MPPRRFALSMPAELASLAVRSLATMLVPALVVFALGMASGCVVDAPSRSAAQRRAALPSVVRDAPGSYDTQRQFDAAPDDLRREPAAGHPYDWLDRQHATFRWVDAPAIGEHVMYLEWRRGGPRGPISRQRLWVFVQRDHAWFMDFYTLPDDGSAPRSRLGDDFRSLAAAQLVGYGADCALPISRDDAGATFRIPASCDIVTRSGRRMRLSATVRFESGRIRYREQGVLDTGAVAFLVPGQVDRDYEFDRVDH